jgi:hypothetical protein
MHSKIARKRRLEQWWPPPVQYWFKLLLLNNIEYWKWKLHLSNKLTSS